MTPPTPSPAQPEHEEARRLAEQLRNTKERRVGLMIQAADCLDRVLALLSKAEQERDYERRLRHNALRRAEAAEQRLTRIGHKARATRGKTSEDEMALARIEEIACAALTSSSEAPDGGDVVTSG